MTRKGYIKVDDHFTWNETRIRDCFALKGVCGNHDCRKFGISSPVYSYRSDYCYRFVLPSSVMSCPVDITKERSILKILQSTDNEEEMKTQLNSLFGYSHICCQHRPRDCLNLITKILLDGNNTPNNGFEQTLHLLTLLFSRNHNKHPTDHA